MPAYTPAPYDQNHPYIGRFIGCGHGKLFTEPCVDCEVIALTEDYRLSIKALVRARDRLHAIGAPLPGDQWRGLAEEAKG